MARTAPSLRPSAGALRTAIVTETNEPGLRSNPKSSPSIAKNRFRASAGQALGPVFPFVRTGPAGKAGPAERNPYRAFPILKHAGRGAEWQAIFLADPLPAFPYTARQAVLSGYVEVAGLIEIKRSRVARRVRVGGRRAGTC